MSTYFITFSHARILDGKISFHSISSTLLRYLRTEIGRKSLFNLANLCLQRQIAQINVNKQALVQILTTDKSNNVVR